MLILPKSWWQLPFSGALLFHAKMLNRCQLCGIYPCLNYQTNLQNNLKINQHWFNQFNFLCEHCHDTIAWQQSTFQLHLSNTHSLTGIASSFYHYPFDKVMTNFKNHHDLRQLMLLVHAIRQLDVPSDCDGSNSAIVVVPTTTKRLRERGFDPLYLLMSYLSFHWQIPIFNQIEREERQHQQGLSRDERLSNVKGAFYFKQLPTVKNLILFDDVVTTGATLQAIIESLREQVKQSAQITPKYRLHARAILHARG